ncbi:MAG: organomercurial lyase [Acidiferrobacter sp.]
MDETAINDTLTRLHAEFPLPARLHHEPQEVQAVYATILHRWIQEGHAPPLRDFVSAIVQRLVERDTIVASPAGLGCYPFSATDTGIRIAYGRHNIHAMCAIDALAIPSLVKDLGIISARCFQCQQPLTVIVNGRGNLLSTIPESILVHYPRGSADSAAPCCRTLCPHIVFSCADCTAVDTSGVLAIEEALAVAQRFFAFQIQLLATYPADRLTRETAP